MKNLTILFALLFANYLLANNNVSYIEDLRNNIPYSGISLGAAIAVTASWSRNQSILWAILHGILGWLYVIYFAITRSKGINSNV